MTDDRITVGLLLFPEMTQLDMTGPYEVFVSMPRTTVEVVWKTLEPVTTGGGLRMLPTTTIAACPRLDVICVPGGPGQVALMQDAEVLDFLWKQAETCRFVTSVCTGSLVLGAAGLLRGYRVTCHSLSLDQLALRGAIPVAERIVRDRNRITGGGVTSGSISRSSSQPSSWARRWSRRSSYASNMTRRRRTERPPEGSSGSAACRHQRSSPRARPFRALAARLPLNQHWGRSIHG